MAQQGELIRDTVAIEKIIPAQGKKSAKVKTDKGFLSAWPEKVKLFEVGQLYDVVIDRYTKDNVVYSDVKEVTHIGHAIAPQRGARPAAPAAVQHTVRRGPAPAPPNGNGAAYQEPPYPEPPPHDQIPPGPSGPAPRNNGAPRDGNDPYWRPKPMPPEDQERIFVAGALYRDMEAGRVFDHEDHFVERIEMWRRIWGRTFGKAA